MGYSKFSGVWHDTVLDEGEELEKTPENSSGDDSGISNGSDSASPVLNILTNTRDQAENILNSQSEWLDNSCSETDAAESKQFGFIDSESSSSDGDGDGDGSEG